MLLASTMLRQKHGTDLELYVTVRSASIKHRQLLFKLDYNHKLSSRLWLDASYMYLVFVYVDIMSVYDIHSVSSHIS